MKQAILFTTLVFSFSFSSIAQLDKKNWLVGGSGSFNSKNDNFQATTVTSEYTRTSIQLSPNIGYFIADKLSVGLKTSLSWNKNKGLTANTTYSTSTATRFDYGPFLRYYFLDKEKPFNLLADVTYQLGNLKLTADKGNRSNLSFMAGPVIYFNSSIGLELLLGYKIEKEKLTKSTSTPQFLYTQLQKGVQVSIGFQFYLEKI